MSNPFTTHNIDHLSVSQLNLWAAAPAIWLLERLLGHKVPVGAAAHRGAAVEAGIVACLQGASLNEGIDTANALYTGLTAFSGDPRRDKERDALPNMVQQGVALLLPWGRPDRCQVEKNWEIDGLTIPIIGFSDVEYDQHGLIVDVKTTFTLPSEIKVKHARQVASYVGAGSNVAGAVAYVTNKRAAIYQVEDVDAHIGALSRQALSLQRFLALSADPLELAGLLTVDADSFYLADPRARQAAWEVFGV